MAIDYMIHNKHMNISKILDSKLNMNVIQMIEYILNSDSKRNTYFGSLIRL